MRVTAHTDPRSFAEVARPLLLRGEAKHCLLLGVLGTLITQLERYQSSLLYPRMGFQPVCDAGHYTFSA
jgi:hypothetical protein